jgi:hypothetical protein
MGSKMSRSVLWTDEHSVFGDACVRGLVGQFLKNKRLSMARDSVKSQGLTMLVEKVIDLLMD